MITMEQAQKIHPRSEKEKKLLNQRLKRVEGQIRGIQKMVDEDRYCIDILVQMSAVQAALKRTGFDILEEHTRGCVTHAAQNGEEKEMIDELMDVIKQFSK
nr:metal-sensing transcriptional repressor [Alkalicoccus halolimnae]